MAGFFQRLRSFIPFRIFRADAWGVSSPSEINTAEAATASTEPTVQPSKKRAREEDEDDIQTDEILPARKLAKEDTQDTAEEVSDSATPKPSLDSTEQPEQPEQQEQQPEEQVEAQEQEESAQEQPKADAEEEQVIETPAIITPPKTPDTPSEPLSEAEAEAETNAESAAAASEAVEEPAEAAITPVPEQAVITSETEVEGNIEATTVSDALDALDAAAKDISEANATQTAAEAEDADESTSAITQPLTPPLSPQMSPPILAIQTITGVIFSATLIAMPLLMPYFMRELSATWSDIIVHHNEHSVTIDWDELVARVGWLAFVAFGGLFLPGIVGSVILMHSILYMKRTQAVAHGAIAQAAFERLVKMRLPVHPNKSLDGGSDAQKHQQPDMVNAVLNDTVNVGTFYSSFHSPLQFTLQIVSILYVLYRFVGLAPTVCVVAVIVIAVPTIIRFNRNRIVLRREFYHRRDDRVGLEQGLLKVMNMLKTYAWEQPYRQKIDEARTREVDALWPFMYWSAISGRLLGSLPILLCVVTFTAVFAFAEPKPNGEPVLDIPTAFAVIAAVSRMSDPLNLLAMSIADYLEAVRLCYR
ncbi:hypothetical protein GQ42DRAFT_178352 [Ramicandelaber brevisporus]|nr:hypothetical protein GQ42DRAFT_178352 [Ramicandelaber brevisporus]